MTFFIVLSGIVLASSSGKRIYSPTKCCTELCPDREDESKFDRTSFYQKRFARTIPMFWLTNVVKCHTVICPLSFDNQLGPSGSTPILDLHHVS